MKKEIQIYRIRRIARGEQIIHTPAECSGLYRLEVDEKGNMHYWKVNA